MPSTLPPPFSTLTKCPVLSFCSQYHRAVLVPQNFNTAFLPGSRANKHSGPIPCSATPTKYRFSHPSCIKSSIEWSWGQLRAPRISQCHTTQVVATAQIGASVNSKQDATAKKGGQNKKKKYVQSGEAVATSYSFRGADAREPVEIAQSQFSSSEISAQYGGSDEASWCGSGESFNEAGGFFNMHPRTDDVTEAKCGVVREVNCSIEVVSVRERKISGGILVDSSWQRVWEVLTDYERLADFIPSLVRSEVIPSPSPDIVRLLQQGVQQAMHWHIEATVVLDMHSATTRECQELHFEMVEGDFEKYSGKWTLLPTEGGQKTILLYAVSVIPHRFLPTIFLERMIKADLPRNLEAVAERAEKNFKLLPEYGDPDSRLLTDMKPSILGGLANQAGKGFKNLSLGWGLGPEQGEGVGRRQRAKEGWGSASGTDEGTTTLPHPRSDHLYLQPVGPTAQLADSTGRAAPWDGERRGGQVDEVHLRRLDDNEEGGGVHRRVVASITVGGCGEDTWRVLTDYEALPLFVPNLAASRVLRRDSTRVWVLQEGVKCSLYCLLHAQLVLELRARIPEGGVGSRELLFHQVEGDFEVFKGKWVVEEVGDGRSSRLKYVVETCMRGEGGVAEGMIEEMIYEDLPANLCAIRDRVERLVSQQGRGVGGDAEVATPEAEGRDVDVGGEAVAGNQGAEAERWVESAAPGDAEVADRRRRRNSGRTKSLNLLEEGEGEGSDWWGDIRGSSLLAEVWETGGARAGRLGAGEAKRKYLTPRRSRFFWANFSNVQATILEVIEESGGDPGVMPSRSQLVLCGRSDVGRALEQWGGAREVGKMMGLRVRHSRTMEGGVKPERFWDEFKNVRAAILGFQREEGSDLLYMPLRGDMERAGRHDLAMALRRWGGHGRVAELLGLRANRRGRPRAVKQTKVARKLWDSVHASGKAEGHGGFGRKGRGDEGVEEVESVSEVLEGTSDVGGGSNGCQLPQKAALPSTSKKWLKLD